uniref:NPYR-14 n=1 Tax=Schmidtea mediterranea TaxID=79327 RepID=A0A193KUX0_SCHMD|nr:NPYR-14 [Schmidtea mediterranea]
MQNHTENSTLSPEFLMKVREILMNCPKSENIHLTNEVVESAASLINRVAQLYTKPKFSAHRISEVFYSLIFLYTSFSFIGFLFNVAVVIALLQHRALTNITNIYIFCLAMSDIFLCSANMPIQAYYEISENSNLSSSMCRILFSSFGLPLYISCLTILLIAIDRHRMIVYPLSRRMSRTKAVLLVISVIMFSLVNSIPVAVYTDINESEYIELLSLTSREGKQFPTYCIESWPTKTTRLIYSVLIFFLHFFVPLSVSAVLYVHIYICLNRRRLFKQKEVERKKRTNKILILVVILFAICWAPWCIFSLLLEVQGYIQQKPKTMPLKPIICSRIGNTTPFSTGMPILSTFSIPIKIPPHFGNSTQKLASKSIRKENHEFIEGSILKPIDLILKLWAMGSAIVNPFLYGWLNEPIRESMCKIWRRIFGFFGIDIAKFKFFSMANRNSSYRPVKDCGLTLVLDEETKFDNGKSFKSNIDAEIDNVQKSNLIFKIETNNDADPWIYNPEKSFPANRTMKSLANHFDNCHFQRKQIINSYDVFLNKGFGEIDKDLESSQTDLDLPILIKQERHVNSPILKDG